MPRYSGAVTIIGTALLLIAALSGCGDRKDSSLFSAVGSYGDIAVLASRPGLYEAAGPFFDRFNPEVTFVLKREDTYDIQHFEQKNWKDARNYRNLIYLVRSGDGGPVEKEAKRLLGDEAFDRLSKGLGGVVTLTDPYFRNQQAIIAVSSNRQVLLRTLNQQAEALADTLRDGIHRRLRRDHLREGVHTASIAHLWSRHGFWLEIPQSFKENQTEPEGFPGIEWIRTNGATRGLTLSWSEVDDAERTLRDHNALAAMRDAMGQALHREELIPESFEWGEEMLGGLPALRLTGAWKSHEVSVGGAFWCYFVSDPGHRRIMCIDLLVYGPDREKMDDFRRLRAIAETFSLHQPRG